MRGAPFLYAILIIVPSSLAILGLVYLFYRNFFYSYYFLLIPIIIVSILIIVTINIIYFIYWLILEDEIVDKIRSAMQEKSWQSRKIVLSSIFSDFDRNSYVSPALADTIYKTCRASIRVGRMLRAFENQRANPHDTLPSLIALDSNYISSQYALLHALTWVLPVLGFIGTAIGLMGSVGGFENILKDPSNLDDIHKLLAIVGKTVISALASSFLVTVFALFASAISYICIVAIESWDAGTLSDIDRVTEDFLIDFPTIEDRHSKIFSQIEKKLSNIESFFVKTNNSSQQFFEASAIIYESSEIMKQLIESLRSSLNHNLIYNVENISKQVESVNYFSDKINNNIQIIDSKINQFIITSPSTSKLISDIKQSLDNVLIELEKLTLSPVNLSISRI